MLAKDFIKIALILSLLLGVQPALAQDTEQIRGPVTALHLEGNLLLIGQQDVLIEAQVSDANVSVIRTVKLNRHDIRALAVNRGVTLVLSEDGLTTLDSNGNAIDFRQGGGQRLAVSGERIYIAALQAGVRMLRLTNAGKLESSGSFATLGAAVDVAAEADGLLWVAESDQGVRLYDTRNSLAPASAPPVGPVVLAWLRDLAPASVVRVSGPRLYAGYGNHVAALDTLNLRSPKLLSTFSMDGAQATIGEMVVQGNRIYVGRVDKAGSDLVTLDLSNPRSMVVYGSFGERGAGERITLRSNDVFLGSGRMGLRRVHLDAEGMSLVKAWEPLAASAQSCIVAPPSDPQPPNLTEVSRGTTTLKWVAGCDPTTFEIRVSGELVATTHNPTYTFTPQRDAISWQITAIDASGKRIDGPVWRFDLAGDGWLAKPALPAPISMVYSPPVVQVDPRSPFVVIATTCAAFLAGLILIIGVAWFIGSRAENRNMQL